jgi:hypothetical protein
MWILTHTYIIYLFFFKIRLNSSPRLSFMWKFTHAEFFVWKQTLTLWISHLFVVLLPQIPQSRLFVTYSSVYSIVSNSQNYRFSLAWATSETSCSRFLLEELGAGVWSVGEDSTIWSFPNLWRANWALVGVSRSLLIFWDYSIFF